MPESMQRQILIKHERMYRAPDGFVPGTMAERIALVWPLTREACALSDRYDADRPMRRQLARLVTMKHMKIVKIMKGA